MALAGALPVRISPIFVGVDGTGTGMSPALAAFVRTRLVPDAAARWAAMLSTLRVQGPLFAHRECTSYWSSSAGGPNVCAAFAATTTCDSGVASDVTISFGASLLGADVVYDQNGHPTTLPAGSGFADTDLGLYVTAAQTGFCGQADTGVLAYATTCQRDQYDRPTWARINLCPLALNATNADLYAAQLRTVVHELAHALGFSSSSWPLFRATDAARTPLTPRDEGFPDQPAAAFLVSSSCAQGSFSQFIAAPSTTAYVSARGMTADGCATGAKPSTGAYSHPPPPPLTPPRPPPAHPSPNPASLAGPHRLRARVRDAARDTCGARLLRLRDAGRRRDREPAHD